MLLLRKTLEELAALEPNGLPFISLHLNAQANQHGRDEFERFVRKELSEHVKAMEPDSSELKWFKRDAERMNAFLIKELDPSSNGLAIFACAGADDYFKAIQLDTPIEKHSMHVSELPHIFPLARLIDQNPRCGVLVADTTVAKLFIFNLGNVETKVEIENANTEQTPDGVKSKSGFKRWTENHRMLYVKEVVETLGQIMERENVENIVLAGDEVIIPLLRQHLPANLQYRIIEVLRLDIKTPEHEIYKATREALSKSNAQKDADKVGELLERYREGGTAVVGLRDTIDALLNGKVSELMLTSSLREITVDQESLNQVPSISAAPKTLAKHLAEPRSATAVADMLVARALSTGAAITFIEDRNLLADAGGVGAYLRYV